MATSTEPTGFMPRAPRCIASRTTCPSSLRTAYGGGKRCRAVTSHLDIAPTLVSLTHASAEKKAAIVKELPGRDFSPLLAAPEKASTTAVRDGSLYLL